MEESKELHALLERAAALMVRAGYRSLGVKVKVGGKRRCTASWSRASTWP